MLKLFIGDDYEIRQNSYCFPNSHLAYPTLAEAKRQCSTESSCAMFYVMPPIADGGIFNYFKCEDGAEIRTQGCPGCTLYIKKSEYTRSCVRPCVST